jgi:hypothetical protein
VNNMMLGGFGLGFLWMAALFAVVWALPLIGAVALIAALTNKKS